MIISGPISSGTELIFLRQILSKHLPYCLPLYRRCQFHSQPSSRPKSGEIWIACSKADVVEVGDCSYKFDAETVIEQIQHSEDDIWIAAHIDLTNPGQTQIWLYASWEPHYTSSSQGILTSPHFPIYQSLFRHLFAYLRNHHIPQLSEEPSEQWQRLKDTGKIISSPYSRSKILFGTVAECLYPFLEESHGDSHISTITREDRGYLKYVVQNPATIVILPNEFYFGEMDDQQLQLVIDRTVIPRTLETLKQLTHVALFNEQRTPVAWGLIGKDASLSSLHTESDYRGKGFAELVSKELFRKQKEVFPAATRDNADSSQDKIVDYAHADVSDKNLPSRRVMEKLGGKVIWRVGWIEVNIDRLS